MRRLAENFAGVVLIDEAYVDFADDSCASLVREYANVIVCRTLSKGYSLAAIRLGFAYANPHLIGGMMKVKDSYNIGSITQQIAVAALSDQATVQANGGRIKAMAFRAADRPLGAALLQTGGAPVHLAGRLRIDDWQGRHDVEFLIDDAAPAS